MNLFGIIIALLIIGILVFVHEFGHFIIAKLSNIRVDEFSIGFGEALISFKIGETTYKLGSIPFGGYCKMYGEESNDRTNDEVKSDPRAMYNRPAILRLLTVLAGPLFNYIFSILILSIILAIGYNEILISQNITVIKYMENGEPTPAFKAGLKNEDIILSINGIKINAFNDIPKIVALNIEKEMEIVYLRNNITNVSKIKPVLNKETGYGFIGVSPLYLNTIGFVKSNSPAYNAGLKEYDKIISINNKEIKYFYEIQDYIEDKPYQKVVLKIQRSNEIINKEVILDRFEGKGYLGISPGETIIQKKLYREKNFIKALISGFNEANQFIIDTFIGLKAIIAGKINVQKNVSGPIRIIQITGEIATKTDIFVLLKFMAFISVNLAFLNLLPIPGLDGGHIVINLIEVLTRYKLPEKIRIVIEFMGIIFIISLSIIVLINDIFNIIVRR